MRELIVWVLFLIVSIVASFQAGYIYRDRQADELRKQVYQLELKTRDLNGRLIGVEATLKRSGGGK